MDLIEVLNILKGCETIDKDLFLKYFQSRLHGHLLKLYKRVLRYDTRCYFNVRSKADISQLNLPHGTDN